MTSKQRFHIFFVSGRVKITAAPRLIIILLLLHLPLLILADQSQERQIGFLIERIRFLNKRLPDSTAYYANKGLELCKKTNDKGNAALIGFYLGVSQRFQGHYQKAIATLEYAEKQFTDLKNYKMISDCEEEISACLTTSGNYSEAIAHSFNSLKIRINFHLDSLMPKSYLTLSNIYYTQNNFLKAELYLKKSLDEAERLNSQKDRLNALINLGNVHFQKENYDSALYYYDLAKTVCLKLKNDGKLAHVYTNLGAVYENQNQISKAREIYQKAMAIHEKLDDKEAIAMTKLNIGVTYDDEKKYKEARRYYFDALDIAKKMKLRKLILLCYEDLSYNYSDEGNFERALYYHQSYSDLNDSLINEASLKHVAELQEKYDAEHRETEIAKLKAEQKLQETSDKQNTFQRNALMISLMFILAILILVVYSYQQKLRMKDILAKQTKDNNKHQINAMLREKELAAMSAMVEGQEQERQRIALELHDQLGSMLSTVKLHYSVLESKFREMGAEHWRQTGSLLDEACNEVRRVAHNMASGVLANFGLAPALKELCESIESSNRIQVSLLTHGLEERVDNTIEINVYRIIQELLNNILKHAEATEVTIQLNRFGQSLNVMVEDNGKGFDARETHGKKGIGLQNVDIRAKRMEAMLTIDSTPGKGTTTILEIPLQAELALGK